MNGTVLAISMDDRETLERFKKDLEAQFPFVADPDGNIVKAFDVKTPVVSYAQRYTFVIGEGRKIVSVQSGSDAIDPSAAVAACPIPKRGGGGADAGK